MRAAAEMDPADVVDRQRRDVLDVAVHEPFESVADADDFHAFKGGADRRGPDHAVDSGGGSAADENGQFLVMLHANLGANVRPYIIDGGRTPGRVSPTTRTRTRRASPGRYAIGRSSTSVTVSVASSAPALMARRRAASAACSIADSRLVPLKI